MEGLKKEVGDTNKYGGGSNSMTKALVKASSSNSSPSYDHSRLLLNRSPSQVVSLWTCSKLCAFCFVAGILVGYTLKRRVRRWASSLLRRLKDD